MHESNSITGPLFRKLGSRIGAASVLLTCLSLPGLANGEDLSDIFELAAERDPQIRQARAQYHANHTQVAQARAQWLPTVSLSGSFSRDTTGTAGPAPPSGDGGSPLGGQQPHDFSNGFSSKSYGMNVSQNLLNFEAWYAFEAAKKSDKAAALNLAQAEQDLILRVAQAYFDLLRSRDNLQTFRAEEEAAERILEQTRERFEVGLVPITDVYDSQANYDLARVNRLVEENNLDQAYEALEAITGVAHSDLETLSEDFPIEGLDDPISQWVEVAVDNNLGVRAAEMDLAASEEQAKSARAAMLPTLEFSASYNWRLSGNSFSFFPNLPNESTGLGISLNVPLYSGGANRASKRQAYYNRNASEESLLQTQRSSVQSVRNSYRSLETDVLAVAAREQAIISAESALEATEVGAEVGTRNVVDIVTAQRTLFQARRDYDTARYNYVMNSLNLKMAAGTLSPQDIYDLNQWLVEEDQNEGQSQGENQNQGQDPAQDLPQLQN